MRNKIFVVLLAFVISGCATQPPAIQTVIQRVEIPIEVPCKAPIPAKPSLGFETADISLDIFEKTKILLSDRQLQLGYELELLTALKSCTSP